VGSETNILLRRIKEKCSGDIDKIFEVDFHIDEKVSYYNHENSGDRDSVSSVRIKYALHLKKFGGTLYGSYISSTNPGEYFADIRNAENITEEGSNNLKNINIDSTIRHHIFKDLAFS